MSVRESEGRPPSIDEDQATSAQKLNKLFKINAVLMDRVERSMDQQGNAFSLFQTAIGLEAKVRSRTEDLTSVLHRLERSNKALVIAKEDAERANLSKTRFLAAASHDLLQPLNAARLSISVLSDLQGSDEGRTLAGQITQSLQTIEDLIDTLLDISKLDAGVVTPEMTVFPLDEVLSVLDASFAPQATAKGLNLEVCHCGLLVRSDPMLLLRILQNLICNAVRYTEAGSVVVRARRRGPDCFIDVADTGSGISLSEREKIFEEFFRGVAGGTHSGLGLGLAIVKRTVVALGHALTVESTLGTGSTFRLKLQHEGGSPSQSDTSGQEANRGPPVTGAVVLLVENDQAVRDATARLLENWSCRAITAHTVREIGACLEDLPAGPDFILADYHLDEGETGLMALEELRRLTGRNVPSVILTADRSPAVVAAVGAAGWELIYKPIKPAELRALMTHLLGPAGTTPV